MRLSAEGLYIFLVQLANTAFFSYTIWVILHYIAAHLYVKHCAQSGLIGFFTSTFHTTTCYCQGLSWLIYTGSRQVLAMWITIGTFFSQRILYRIGNVKNPDSQ